MYARKLDIVWDEEDLKHLLRRRISEVPELLAALGIAPSASDDEVFDAVFSGQVDYGKRKPSTWTWMMSRIRNGNHVRPPRNLIDLVKKAQEAQERAEVRGAREYGAGQPVVGPDAIKRGLSALSQQRVEDTLLAEAGELAMVIDRFRGGKAEYDEASLVARSRCCWWFAVGEDVVGARPKTTTTCDGPLERLYSG